MGSVRRPLWEGVDVSSTSRMMDHEKIQEIHRWQSVSCKKVVITFVKEAIPDVRARDSQLVQFLSPCSLAFLTVVTYPSGSATCTRRARCDVTAIISRLHATAVTSRARIEHATTQAENNHGDIAACTSRFRSAKKKHHQKR
ncbi:hypothetical protein MSG28_003914 [Choristoneura fumiferana]|uniref:Uncharacterized protein n=1 Tax=Choristoneura fumiferana TaxID=7141 RepID=A0ACC0KGN1_CHOFU|nr:hypothetical protein MSG28_003914 [Choristoneura fumiferana]